jgi:hypothetical protein
VQRNTLRAGILRTLARDGESGGAPRIRRGRRSSTQEFVNSAARRVRKPEAIHHPIPNTSPARGLRQSSALPWRSLTAPDPPPSLRGFRIMEVGTKTREESMKRTTVVLAGLLLTAFAPGAWALSKGGSMLAIELTHGTADFADKTNGSTTTTAPFTAQYISAYTSGELGVQAQYWYLMADDYAVTVSGGIGFMSEKDAPGQGATTGSPDHKFSTSSFNIRLGGDRVVKVGDRAMLYGGPGLEFWSGRAKYEDFILFDGSTRIPEYKDESTIRFGLSARLGGTMMINPSFGLTTHVGTRIGYASVEEQGAKATWWPSSVEGSLGLLFAFGD